MSVQSSGIAYQPPQTQPPPISHLPQAAHQAKEPSSAIPKPMAAIKGMSKAMPEPQNLKQPKVEAKNVALVSPISVAEETPKVPEKVENTLKKEVVPDVVLQPPDNESDDDFIAPMKSLNLIRPRYYLGTSFNVIKIV
jgi:hypothetical protein